MTQSEIRTGRNPAAFSMQEIACHRGWIAAAALAGAISVVAGAIASHALDPAQVTEIGWLRTGSLYQAVHALALLALGALAGGNRIRTGWLVAAETLFLVGVILFPAALYSLAFHGPRWISMAAPVGGTCFIAGWLALAVGAFLQPEQR
jgi:uncharacterized membrane protein YgdD (TMEM256/DUF423 family)